MKRWKRWMALIACVALVAGGLPFALGMANHNPGVPWSFNAPGQNANPFTSRAVHITNSDFSSGNSSNFVFNSSVDSWTSGGFTSTTIGGALNLPMFPRFKNEQSIPATLTYMNTPPTNMGNDRALVLANKSTNVATAHFTSTQVELEADSHYIISVDFYAVQGFGSFYLIPDEDLDDKFIPSIDLPQAQFALDSTTIALDRSSWRTARFFVSTDILSGQNFSLGLYLGSKHQKSAGVIYFQNPSVDLVSHEVLVQTQNRYNNPSQSEFRSRHLVKTIDMVDHVKDNKKVVELSAPQFESTTKDIFDTFAMPSVSSSSIPTLLNFDDVNYLHLPKKSGADNIMLLKANNAHASIKLKEPFLIRRHQIYMINFYSLTSNGQSSTIRIRDGEDFDSGHRSLSILGRDTLNMWALNTFFITGENFYDTEVDIEFWIGSEDSDAYDYVLIDGSSFQITRVSHEYWETHGQGLTEANLNVGEEESPTTIANASFNKGTIRNVDTPYPLKAKDWGHTFKPADEDIILSGIINGEAEHWGHYARNGGYGGASALPWIINGNSSNNNVFMMQNRGEAAQSLSSSPITLNSGVINIIEFDVMLAQIPSSNFNFWVSAHVKGREVATLNLSTIRKQGWDTYYIAVKESEVSSRELTLTFNMGGRLDGRDLTCNASVVYIDNINMLQTDQMNDVPRTAVSTDLTDPRKFFSATNATAMAFPNDLWLYSGSSTVAGTVVNTLTETLEGGNYYEYRVRLRIGFNMQGFHLCRPGNVESNDPNDFNDSYCTNINDHDWGINFTLDGFDGGFYNLNYSQIMEMEGLLNNYVELVFYIRPDSVQELALRVTFGDEYVAVLGEVFIREFSLRKIEEEEFQAFRADYADASHVAFITQSHHSSDESGTPREKTPVQWWILVPSLIMGVTIIFTLVMFFLRRFKFRLHIDKHHTSYASDDRSARTRKK